MHLDLSTTQVAIIAGAYAAGWFLKACIAATRAAREDEKHEEREGI